MHQKTFGGRAPPGPAATGELSGYATVGDILWIFWPCKETLVISFSISSALLPV